MKLKKLFKYLCHQIPDRSYFFSGEPLYVCSRCLGIYTGFLAGFFWLILLYGSFRAGLRLFWILLLFIPMAYDGITQIFGMRKSTNRLRFVSGFLGGIGTAFMAYAGIGITLNTYLNRELFLQLPTLKSLSGILFVFPFYYVLEKYQSRNMPFLKNLFNGLSFVSLLTIVGGIVLIYSFFLFYAIF